MKTRLLLPIFSLFLFSQHSTAGTAFGGDDDQKKVIILDNLSTIDAIDASSGWNIIVHQGTKQSVRLEVSPKLADRITAEVRGGKLQLSIKKGLRLGDINVMNTTRTLNAYITVTDLKRIECSGGVDMKFATPIRHDGSFVIDISGGADVDDLKLFCQNLEVKASGGADIEVKMMSEANVKVSASGGADVDIVGIKAQKCLVEVSGGSDATMSGEASELVASCSGGAGLSAARLQVKEATARCSGAASATVYVTERLEAKASGASNIYYYGDPKDVSKSANGVSSIKHRK